MFRPKEVWNVECIFKIFKTQTTCLKNVCKSLCYKTYFYFYTNKLHIRISSQTITVFICNSYMFLVCVSNSYTYSTLLANTLTFSSINFTLRKIQLQSGNSILVPRQATAKMKSASSLNQKLQFLNDHTASASSCHHCNLERRTLETKSAIPFQKYPNIFFHPAFQWLVDLENIQLQIHKHQWGYWKLKYIISQCVCISLFHIHTRGWKVKQTLVHFTVYPQCWPVLMPMQKTYYISLKFITW